MKCCTIISLSQDKIRYGALEITCFAFCNISLYMKSTNIQPIESNHCLCDIISTLRKLKEVSWVFHIQALVSPFVKYGRLWQVVLSPSFTNHITLHLLNHRNDGFPLKSLFILQMWVVLVDVPLSMFNSKMWQIFHSFGLPSMFLQIIYFGIRKRSILCTLLQHKQ
jgi:hypothetical protein